MAPTTKADESGRRHEKPGQMLAILSGAKVSWLTVNKEGFRQPVLQVLRRLLGEGSQDDRTRCHAVAADELQAASDKNLGLAGARSSGD